MSPQNDLLSYTFKETIFLTAEKAGIKSLTELELEPNVEIFENEAGVSIIGYLLLTAKYDPINEAEEERESGEGAKSLVEAMKFTPFRLEQGDSADDLYAGEQDFTHRIPVNITISQADIGERADIGAIVNSIDYEILGTNQVMVQAELQITGLSLQEQGWDAVETDDSASYPPPLEFTNQYADSAEGSGENWEYVHTTEEQQTAPDPYRSYDPYQPYQQQYAQYEPTSLDEIERKLDELEQEIAFQNQNEQQSSYYPFGSQENNTQATTHPFPPYDAQTTNYGYPQSAESPYPPSAQSPYASPYFQTPSSDVAAQNWHVRQESGEQSAEPTVPLQFGDISFSEQQESARHVEHGESKTFDSPHLQAMAEGLPLEGNQPFDGNQSLEAEQPFDVSPVSAHAQQESVTMQQQQQESAALPSAAIPEAESAESTQPNEVSFQSDLKMQAESYPLQDSPLHAEVRAEEPLEEEQGQELAIHTDEQTLGADDTQEVMAELENTSEEPESLQVDAQEQTADNKEVKIAISTKAAKEPDESVNITNLFTARRDVRSDPESASSSARGGQSSQEPNRSSLELFSSLSSYAQGQSENFSRLRMCIIQRNETLEGIAARYSMSMSKLMEVNRLSSDRIAAGQILYIP